MSERFTDRARKEATEEPALLPCPFCLADPDIREVDGDWQISCQNGKCVKRAVEAANGGGILDRRFEEVCHGSH